MYHLIYRQIHHELKFAVGCAIAAVLDEMVTPAVREFTEQAPVEATWLAIAKGSAANRASK